MGDETQETGCHSNAIGIQQVLQWEQIATKFGNYGRHKLWQEQDHRAFPCVSMHRMASAQKIMSFALHGSRIQGIFRHGDRGGNKDTGPQAHTSSFRYVTPPKEASKVRSYRVGLACCIASTPARQSHRSLRLGAETPLRIKFLRVT